MKVQCTIMTSNGRLTEASPASYRPASVPSLNGQLNHRYTLEVGKHRCRVTLVAIPHFPLFFWKTGHLGHNR
ncbi:hypothetical protein INR49_025546 [Caranx melampygus]|nr:hypothetical protein INR49_025546 [Caranx melampygus]